MVETAVGMAAGFLVVQRIGELYIARLNRKWSLEQGAVEFGARHYPLFLILHTGWFIGWVTEALKINMISPFWPAWLALFIAAQGLRYWCILTLGRQWNTRILVIPGYKAVRRGPYRYLPHPNYLAVAIELIAIPMLFGAVLTAFVSTVLNAALLFLIRIPEEEKALRLL